MTALRVGITGGIGTGKSTVCRIFHETFGIPVFDADACAKALIANDPALQAGIVRIFGEEAYTESGAYNRVFVANIAFSDPSKLAALNALVHPAVERESLNWHQAQTVQGHPYTLKEAALLVESGAYKHLDFLIVVSAPEEMRIQRVMARDGVSEEQVMARIRGQLLEADKLALADLVILNDGEQLLLPQVWAAHQRIMQLAKANG